MKRRYTVERTKYKKWFNIIDHTEETAFFMHLSDFGIISKQLPKYCLNDAIELFESTQAKKKSITPIYYRHGIKYRKLNRNEKITINCLHSFDYGELHEIMNPAETVGQTPADFSDEREFYIPIKEKKS